MLLMRLCALVISVWIYTSLTYAQLPTPSPSVTPQLTLEQQLIKEQIEYYKTQTENIKKNKSTADKLLDNPSGLVTVLGAFIAAGVALISFLFNYRATLRNQSDTQFYEAVKLFGDKDSVTLRTSAAMMLANMGAKGSKRNRPYFNTSLDQLLTGLLLEANEVAQKTITLGIQQLTQINQAQVVKKLHALNLDLQRDFIRHLGEFFVGIHQAQNFEATSDDSWNRVALITPFEQTVVKELASRFKAELEHSVRRAVQSFDDLESANQNLYLPRVQQSFEITATRLNLSISTCANAIRLFPPPRLYERSRQGVRQSLHKHFDPLFFIFDAFGPSYSSKFGGMVLVKADLTSMELFNIDMSRTLLQGANLSNSNLQIVSLKDANLSNAQLNSAKMREVDLSNANLQNADLSYAVLEPDVNLDKANLEGAHLGGTTLQGVNLGNVNLANADVSWAKLYGARITKDTNLTGVEWWKAEFYDYTKTSTIDKSLIEQLLQSYPLPENNPELSFSVKEFLATRSSPESQTVLPE
jgi:pentapeptide repeat protein